MPKKTICGLEVATYLIRMEEFHGYRSPGMLLGGLMIENALEQLGQTSYLNVACETVVCLPDAVQLLTPCTFGNGFLQILDWGKFALTVYDRQNLSGVRIWLDDEAIGSYPVVHQWFHRTGVRREKPPFEDLASEILSAGSDVICSRRVRLPQPIRDRLPVPTSRCPSCGESYPIRQGATCIACQGEAYFYVLE